MATKTLERKPRSRPETYDKFIEDAKRAVSSRGLVWDIPLDESGQPVPGRDWDIRQLNDSHERSFAGTNGFAVDEEIRTKLASAGVAASSLRDAGILPPSVQDFIKAFIVVRAGQRILARTIRHESRAMRRFWSSHRKQPWELNSDDVQRYIDLAAPREGQAVSLQAMVREINAGLLSHHCPLELVIPQELQISFGMALHERASAEKLPDRVALVEATRIAFHEAPVSHLDRVRFAAIRVLILTGLRINEVLMLPEVCYEWQEHLDIVTGKRADAIGGVGRSLVLHFFAEKHAEGAPDVLVEDVHHVPDDFAPLVEEALREIQRATAGLRRVLRAQHADPDSYPESDLREFKTSTGRTITSADLLFLAVVGSKTGLPRKLPHDLAIRPLASSSFYLFVSNPGSPKSMFVKYGRTPEMHSLAIRPHELRHLMNAELFRQEVADTVITQHFHRQTVAQSYEYDHRTLAERLAFVELPSLANDYFQPGGPQDLVARMIVSGVAAESHIGRSFAKIQAERGEEAAFAYLAANSDGFHVTPYGFCTNSFSLNPCARHLKCFDNCRHFMASGTPAHVESLRQLREKLRKMRDLAAAMKPGTVGRTNQISHANQLLDGVDRAIKAQPGDILFPKGEDRSTPHEDLFE